MVNYQLGKIYKIVCNTTGLIYIGSTCEPTLARRLMKHRSNYKEYLNAKGHFLTSFKILENSNFEIILIENFPCTSKDELHKQERFSIENIECVNKQIPCRTIEEYYKDNSNKLCEKGKLYYEKNKIAICEKQKIYYEKNKNKQNKDEIKIKQQLYRDNNADIIKQKAKIYRDNKKNLKTLVNVSC